MFLINSEIISSKPIKLTLVLLITEESRIKTTQVQLMEKFELD